MINDFIELLNDEIDGKIRSATLGFSQTGRIVLGGVSGPDGGLGSPPGGFIGKLAQKYVTYDETELAASGGVISLVDNLNHIRYNINVNTGDITVISGFVQQNITDISQNVSDIFQNTVDIAQNTADIIVLSGELSEGFIGLIDTPETYVGSSGILLSVADTEDAVVFQVSVDNSSIKITGDSMHTYLVDGGAF